MADLRTLLADASGRAADYLEGLDARPVAPAPEAVERLRTALAGPLPEAPSDAAEVLAFLDAHGSPATIANAGPRYFGFVTGGALPATLAANVLAGAWDQNSLSWVNSPATAALEETALAWLKEALDLPGEAGGALVTGATMANFTCLAAARNRVLRDAGWDADRDGLFGAPPITVAVGEEAHASLIKVLSMLGLGRDRVVRVPVDGQGRMRADDLPALDGPSVVCLQAGNVNSGAFDPAEPLIDWAHGAGAWVHVDGAFGLWARAAPDLAALAQDYERADSWATDAHKWLNVPYDCGIALVRDPAALSQAMSISGAYLIGSERRDAMDFTPDSSRRARSVEVWAALQSLGRSGLAEMVQRNCRQARRMAEGLAQGGAEILNEVCLNQVVAAFGDAEHTARVIARVQEDGTCWCGGTEWQGRKAMRISVSSWATTDADIERSIEAILRALGRNDP
ncbi:MAG: aminotransferase class V-fold PLP-dependent enzyme [Paracoccaceae bacterium]|nr:aminotransferase class V-fold PLP-dependent enzyme [Paracoccaceae bacterium]